MSKFFNLSTFAHSGCVCRHLLVTVTIHHTAGICINILYLYKPTQLAYILCNALSNLMSFLLYELRKRTNVITNRSLVVTRRFYLAYTIPLFKRPLLEYPRMLLYVPTLIFLFY